MKKIYAEDLNYWKTGQASPDAWISKAKAEVQGAGGAVQSEVFGADATGRAMFALEFDLAGDRYRACWPVLPCRAPSAANERAARVQAATMLYHDIKARAVAARVLGARAAFLTFLLLADGRTAADASTPELADRMPRLLGAPAQDGEVRP